MSHPLAYYEGKTQRQNNLSRSANPYRNMTNQWAWWMAGYNDKDIQISNEKENNYVPSNTRAY